MRRLRLQAQAQTILVLCWLHSTNTLAAAHTPSSLTASISQQPLAAPSQNYNCVNIGDHPFVDGTTRAPTDGYITGDSTVRYGTSATVGTTTPKTCYSNREVSRTPHRVDGECGSSLCNGYDSLVPLGEYNEASWRRVDTEFNGTKCHDVKSCIQHVQRQGGKCYSDTDCQFYSKDSSGLMRAEIVGSCVGESENAKRCECLPAYFGANCEFKRCPVAHATGFMCNGVQGEGGNTAGEGYMSGEDYYGPVKMEGYHDQYPVSENSAIASYSGSEWNLYDQVLNVSFDISTSSTHMQRGETQVGGTCDFETGLCHCRSTWYGPACELRKCPLGIGYNQLAPTTCSGQGDCVAERDGQNAVCKCRDNFHGLDCSLIRCPNSTRGFICDNPLLDTPERTAFYSQAQFSNGSISGHQCNWQSGHCQCSGDFFGPDCTFKRCPRVGGRVCNGQGACYAGLSDVGPTSEGNFTDSLGMKHNFAPTFTDRVHTKQVSMPDGNSPHTERSGWMTGQRYGVCACRWPFFGEDCSLRMCPNSTNEGSGSGLTCDGHGTCDHSTGFCTCESGYFGRDCHLRLCPFSAHNRENRLRECNGHGVCDREWGTCLCNDINQAGPSSTNHENRPNNDYRGWNDDWSPNKHVYGVSGSQAPVVTAATDHDLDRWLIGMTIQVNGTALTIDRHQLAPTASRLQSDRSISQKGRDFALWLEEPFWGDSCQKIRCPGHPNECSGDVHGSCNQATGVCTCTAGWFGEKCANPCPGEFEPCMGKSHGECNLQTGRCECTPVWAGADCNIPATECDERLDGNGTGYRGCQSRTVSGRLCQSWNTQYPHTHDKTPETKPLAGLTNNLCRNPDAHTTIWCYTVDPNVRFEECSPL